MSSTSSAITWLHKEEPLLNGFEKKHLFLLTIEALFYNKRVNLEFHLHLLVQVLVKLMVSSRVSLNASDFEAAFREKAAALLARLVNKWPQQL